MCLIIHKPEGATVPEWLVESAQKNNPDGFGIMSRRGVVKKARASAEEAMDIIDAHRDTEAAIHFRYRTAGDKSKRNAHPHKVGKLHAMHNGTLAAWASHPTLSDTRLFLDTWLAPRMRNGAFPARSEVERILGQGNRLVTMAPGGQFTIYNHAHGVMESDLWLSNTYAWDYPGVQVSEWDWSTGGTMRDLIAEETLDFLHPLHGLEDMDRLRPYGGGEDDWNLFYDLVDGLLAQEDYIGSLSDEGLLDLYNHLRETC
jgi:hypothetical protein